MSEKENITMQDIDNLVNVVNSDTMRKHISEERDTIINQKDQMMESLTGMDSEKEFITENLKRFETTEDLAKYLTNNQRIDELFTNPETGEVLEVNLDMSNDRKYQFKKDLLLYFKSSDENLAKIDAEYEKLDIATKEFQQDVAEASCVLADNVLLYVSDMKNRVENMEDGSEKKRLQKSILGVESGYDMALYKETYLKHPGAMKHCIGEVKKTTDAMITGRRYLQKLKSNKVRLSLIPYISDPDSGRLSFEKMVLLPDDYKVEDLFVYSIIRFFAMESWDEPWVRQAHATISLNIKKLVSNDIDDEIKAKLKTSIIDYLKIFEE